MTNKELGVILSIKIDIEPIKKCWFIRNRDWSNYTTIKGKKAHRLVYRLCVGPLKNGHMVCHMCDRPGCINPKHLFQGTCADNIQDAINKGRMKKFKLRGEISKRLRELDRWRQIDEYRYRER